MLKRNLTTLAVVAMLSTGALSAFAMSPSVSGDVAREAGEGPRGEGKGHPFADLKDVIARAAGEGPRGEGKGHPFADVKDVIAREAGEGPRGGDHERPGDRQRRGGRSA